MSINELQQDSAEFAKLLQAATRNRVKNALIAAKAEVDREIVTLDIKEKQAEERKASVNAKRYFVELHEYAWDQSEKFVKIFVNLDGAQSLPEDNVEVQFTANTMKLVVKDLNNKDYGLTINNLLESIDVEKSYRKIKTSMIAIYMKKQKEGEHWDQLTTIQKRLKQKRDDDLKPDNKGGSEDAIMKMMQKMYQSGDSKTKQMIAKAWTEAQQKSHAPDDMPMSI